MKNFEGISDSANKHKIAIICVGYNRLHSLECLFSSLEQAHYPSNDIPLVVSIDASGDEDVYAFVREYIWPYGDKYVNIQTERLGLKKHIYKCGDLSQYFKGIIILEDDSFVAPYFYEYAETALSKYSDDIKISGISLYISHNNEYVNVPFWPLNKGADVFLLQDVQTRGECFSWGMWSKFKEWLKDNENRDYAEVLMPEPIKSWTKAWSKYYYAYMVESETYFVYPYTSFVTNMGAVGEHANKIINVVQVALEYGKKKYVMPDSSFLVRYDAFYSNEDIYVMLGYEKLDLCIDYYGFNKNISNRRYLLSCKRLPYLVVKSFGLHMYPIEMNIRYNIPGECLYLYDTYTRSGKPVKKEYDALSYVYCKHNPPLMLSYVIRWYKARVINKIKCILRK